jgi:arylsulfatase A-like enzyme
VNLVFIVSDTLRWDYLGAYGNNSIHTPSLDALAAESALFLDAYAEGLPTINARRVIMTGRNIFPFEYRPQKSDPVQQHGWHPLYDEDVTLAEHLRACGYFTAFFNDVYHLMKPGKNFHRGFEQWFWIRGQEDDPYAFPDRLKVEDLLRRLPGGRDLPDSSWLIRHLVLRQQWKSDADTLVGQTMSQAADWVRHYTLRKPFYLHVECFDPHEPWDPPAEYARRYEPGYGESLDGCAPPDTTDGLPPERLANILAAYAGEVTLVDRWVGHLLDALHETGRMEDTLVIFTSDHGCMLGEQGQLHKGTDRLRNQVTRVPLLMRHPRGEAAGNRVAGFCQHQDVMPTALRIMGEPIPQRVFGRSLWPQALGKSGAPDYVVSGFCFHACLRTAKWNLVRPWFKPSTAHGGEGRLYGSVSTREELYDLESDPQELTNVAVQHPEVARELSRRLEEHIRRFAPLTTGTLQGVAPIGEQMTFDGLPGVDR